MSGGREPKPEDGVISKGVTPLDIVSLTVAGPPKLKRVASAQFTTMVMAFASGPD